MNQPTGGQFVWSELMTDDVERAKDFYQKVIGWGDMPFPESDTGYTLWTVDGTPVGGLMRTPEEAGGASSFWMHYIETGDVDTTAARAGDLGGTVHVQPRDIPGVGRFAVLMDPQGASFAVLAPTPAGEPPPKPDRGTFVWYELGSSTDPETVLSFYSTLFGWRKTEVMDMGAAGPYLMFNAGGEQAAGGIYRASPGHVGPPVWVGYVGVPDVDEAARKIPQLGGVVLYEPSDVPGGRAMSALDPFKAVFGLLTFTGT